MECNKASMNREKKTTEGGLFCVFTVTALSMRMNCLWRKGRIGKVT